MILDEFVTRLPDGSEIAYMATLRTFSTLTHRWEMTFLAAHLPQLITTFTGALVEGEMRLDGKGQTPTGAAIQSRVRFFDIGPTSFQWENSLSLDQGKSWYRDSAISAQRT